MRGPSASSIEALKRRRPSPPPRKHIRQWFCSSQIQARPSKSKPGQAIPNKNAWICLVLFVRIGTFQSVTAVPNKNFLPVLLLAARRPARRVFVSHGSGKSGTTSDFHKGIESKNCGVNGWRMLSPADPSLTDRGSRLVASVGRYSLTVEDFHLILLDDCI
jgi:hypothetical protein